MWGRFSKRALISSSLPQRCWERCAAFMALLWWPDTRRPMASDGLPRGGLRGWRHTVTWNSATIAISSVARRSSVYRMPTNVFSGVPPLAAFHYLLCMITIQRHKCTIRDHPRTMHKTSKDCCYAAAAFGDVRIFHADPEIIPTLVIKFQFQPTSRKIIQV